MNDMDLFNTAPRDVAVEVLHAATAIYTCEPVVDRLLDRVRWPHDKRLLVDTSCGDGAFLRRALDRLLQRQPGLTDAQILERICGWEIHPLAAVQARAQVAEVLRGWGHLPVRARALSERIVRCGDFLTEGPTDRHVDVIIGNPPYLRFVNVPQPLRGEYEQLLPAYAQADLLHSFLDRSTRVLRRDGELALIVSDRWLYNASAANLREVIGQHFRVAHVERLDAGSAFYRPKYRRAGSPPRVHPCAVVLSSAGGRPLTRDPIYPGVEQPNGEPDRVLGAVAQVRLAPWLGTAGIFLVDAATARRLPQEHLVPAIDTDDIRGGVLRAPTRMAIRTSPGQRP